LFSLGRLLFLAGLVDLKLTADFLCHEIVDLAVPRNRGYFSCGRIDVNRVPAALPKEALTAGFDVTNPIDPLHQEASSKGSRLTFWPIRACSAKSRFASSYCILAVSQLDDAAQQTAVGAPRHVPAPVRLGKSGTGAIFGSREKLGLVECFGIEDRSDGGGIMSLCSKSLIDYVLAHRND